jgi:hypothetical protein
MSKHSQAPNFLDMVPLRNVEKFAEEDGKITLFIPKFKAEWMRKWFVPARKSPYFRIHLDEMGSKVWRLVDNKKTTGEICILLKGEDCEEISPEKQIELRVTTFLNQLYKNRFIMFASGS